MHDPAPTYIIGDKVLLKQEGLVWDPTAGQGTKLAQPFLGPFRITFISDDKLNVTLDLPFWMKCHCEFHISLVKHWVDPTLISNQRTGAFVEPAPLSIDADGDTYEVEAILDKRKRRGHTQYLIRWKGYDQEFDTWEPEEYVNNCQELLDDYYQEQTTIGVSLPHPSTTMQGMVARGAVAYLHSEGQDALV